MQVNMSSGQNPIQAKLMYPYVITSAENIWEKGEGIDSAQTIQSEVYKNNAKGLASVSEGAATDAHSFASHAEGYMTSTGKHADYSHTEGYKTSTQGVASHAEGDNTVTNNPAEHAEGRYNRSNMGGTAATNTLSSIGIGNGSGSIPGGERKNAIEIMQNGDAYLIGVGNYDGANYSSANSVQDVVNSVESAIRFESDFEITYPVGLYSVGDVISAGTSVIEVIKNMLSSPQFSIDLTNKNVH